MWFMWFIIMIVLIQRILLKWITVCTFKKKIAPEKKRMLIRKKRSLVLAHVFVMGVQAVKLAPVNNSSSLYFTTKVKVHNFTIYNLKTTQCSNYWWHEGESDMVASMFVTCITVHLNKYCKDKLSIILWYDGCGYQNRNLVLANAFLNYSIETKKDIQ